MKKIKELTKKQKFVVSLAAIALVAAMIGTVVVLQSTSKKSNIELKKDVYTIEFGQKYSTKKEDYVKADKEILEQTSIAIDGKGIDSISLSKGKDDFLKKYSVGKYKGVATYKDERLEFVLEIKDTAKPEFTDFKARVEIVRESSEDIAVNFKATDLSEVTITVDLKDVDLTKAGEYKAKAIATDAHKNKETKEFTVIVGEKSQAELDAEKQAAAEEQNQQTQQEQQNQGSSSGTNNGSTNGATSGNGSSGGNTGGSAGNGTTGGTTTPTPPPPAKVCDHPVGNSGQWWPSENDAYNWADTQALDKNSVYFLKSFTTWGTNVCGYTVNWR